MENMTASNANEFVNNSLVGIFLPITNLEHVIPYFISHRIPFSIDYKANESLENLKPSGTVNSTLPSSIPVKISYNGEEITKEIFNKYIENADFKNPPIEAEIAKKYGLSIPFLRTNIKLLYKKTLYQLFLDKRMERAKELLLKGYSCTQVSEAVGYGKNSSIKFNKMFQKHYKVTPKKFQISNLRYYSS